ncbi:MAG: biotin synthase BioB [Candidatus Heimdallarchaeota archaeon]|nr:biotin synthase BioB [Candidatus Heimdallarchaeota archaeon]
MKNSDINSLLELPFEELIGKANKVRKASFGDKLELCSIINAKSGLCAEDCKFCAQSAKNATQIPTYPLKKREEIIEAAVTAKKIGAEKFGIVTSGNRLTAKEIDMLAEVITVIKNDIGIMVCASLGALTEEEFKVLTQAGLSQYHHNIETSENFYPQIVTTHSFQERLDTIRAAKKVGLEVCSGGIIGMGESWQDRIDMAWLLRDLKVDAVPLNILVPMKGTCFEGQSIISCVDVIKTICLFRIILKNKVIKIAAGRETVLKDFQALGFRAGANGMLIGGYLTIQGRELNEDYKLIEEIKKLWNE